MPIRASLVTMDIPHQCGDGQQDIILEFLPTYITAMLRRQQGICRIEIDVGEYFDLQWVDQHIEIWTP